MLGHERAAYFFFLFVSRPSMAFLLGAPALFLCSLACLVVCLVVSLAAVFVEADFGAAFGAA
jgi:ABC-type polysaccharide/polyol phosphate export permease